MFRGGLPQLTDTSVLFDASRRHILGTVTTGSVLVSCMLLRWYGCGGIDQHTSIRPSNPCLDAGPDDAERIREGALLRNS